MRFVCTAPYSVVLTQVCTQRPPDVRLRAVFIENITGPVLKMFGTKYNIEPFYWSSALNHIPAQYQEDLRPGEGDRKYPRYTSIRSNPDCDMQM